MIGRLLRKPHYGPETEIVRFITKNDAVAYCQIVRRQIGRQRHVAFLNVAGSHHHPTGHIEGLASSALRVMGAPAASLVFWDVDRYEWEDRTSVHRVEFAALRRGWFSGPRWIPESLPAELAAAVQRAQQEIFLTWTDAADGGRR